MYPKLLIRAIRRSRLELLSKDLKHQWLLLLISILTL
jgi:hypothetical protein